jgi:hypothetical protein
MSLRRAAAVIALGAALLAAASLPHLGLTIDEPALFYAGDRTLFALTHPTVPGALAYDGAEPPGFHSAFPRLPDRDDPRHYPVLPGLIAAAADGTAGRVLRRGAVDGHHLGLLLLSAALLFGYTIYAGRLLGTAAGLTAGAMLACFPTAVGHFASDGKDWPCAGFYALAVLAAATGALRQERRSIWAAGVWLGLALSCKQNGLFAAVTILLAVPVLWPCLRAQPRLREALLAMPFLGAAIFLVAWPWLWWGGLHALGPRLGEAVGFARAFGSSARGGLSAHPLRCLLFMTPPLVLICAGAALAFGRGRREALLAIWLLLPLVRIALPHANFYDANRHFLEYVPALCALGGLGAVTIWQRLRARPHGRALATAGAALAALALLAPIVRYHPFEGAYFNMLAGGLGGAQRRALFRAADANPFLFGTEGDYWSSGLRDAVRLARAATPGPVGVCAWEPELAALDATPPPPVILRGAPDEAPVVIVSPREGRCPWKRVHELERWRPVLARAERGGGLIYEVLGPRGPAPHAPVSPPTAYDP